MNCQLSAAILITSLSLGAGASAAPCYAQQSAAGGTASSQTINPISTISAPGLNVQKDAYQRADENLATQTVYFQNRISTLQHERDDTDNPLASDPSRLSAETQGFCDGSDSGGSTQCLDDYIETERKEMEQLKNPLVGNSTAMSALNSDALDANGKSLNPYAHGTTLGLSPAVPAGNTSPNAFAPSVPTFSDLTPLYAATNSTNKPKVSSPNLSDQAWARMISAPPQQSEYNQTQSVLIDPSNPSLGSEQVLMLKSDGSTIPDPGAYQAALRAWRAGVAKEAPAKSGLYQDEYTIGKGPTAQTFAARVAADATANQSKNSPQVRSPSSLTAAVDANPKSQKTITDPASIRTDYMAARDIVVQNFNANNGPTPSSLNFSPTSQSKASPSEQKAYYNAQNGIIQSITPPPSTATGTTTTAVYIKPGDIDQYVDDTFDDTTTDTSIPAPTPATTP
jgi:hypothetical protein